VSRRIEDLDPSVQLRLLRFAGKMAEVGIPWMITCTYRSQEEQDALYEQGRTKPGKVVTWTHTSRHTSRMAFDIAILKDGKPTWDVKVSVNGNEVPDYLEAGQIGEEFGLTWGGRWKKPDYPHFELKEG